MPELPEVETVARRVHQRVRVPESRDESAECICFAECRQHCYKGRGKPQAVSSAVREEGQ